MPHLSSASMVAAAGSIAIGVTAVAISSGYTIGTARSMGPGYFPLMLGLLMLVAGTGIALFEARSLAQKPLVRAPLAILSAIAAFALIIERFGLAPAVLAAVLISSAARPDFSLRRALIVGIGMSIFTVLLFKYGLQSHLEPIKW